MGNQSPPGTQAHSSARTERLHPIRRRRHPDITAPAACGARHDHGRRPLTHWALAAPLVRARAQRGATPRARTRRRIGAEKAGALCFGSLNSQWAICYCVGPTEMRLLWKS